MKTWEKYFATGSQIEKHNQEAKKVWEAYYRDKPIRVPASFRTFDPWSVIYRDEAKSFEKYYKDPEEMLKVQAEQQYLESKIITDDKIIAENEKFSASLDYWPFSDEAYWGCKITYSKRIQPKVSHLYDKEKIDPDKIQIPHPFEDNIMGLANKTYIKIKQLIKDGYKIFGKTFSDYVYLVGMYYTYGIFNTATQLRGTKIFSDFYDDPSYVKKLLNKIAEGYILRSNAWSEIAQRKNMRQTYKEGQNIYNAPGYYPFDRPVVYDHGYDMISKETYEEFLLPVVTKIHNSFGEGWDKSIEFCGHGEKIPIYLHKKFGINTFTNLNTAFVDIEKLRHEMGPDVQLLITIHPDIVTNGTPEKITGAVKDVLTNKKIKGDKRLIFCESDNFTAPIENSMAMYEAVKEYGGY